MMYEVYLEHCPDLTSDDVLPIVRKLVERYEDSSSLLAYIPPLHESMVGVIMGD